MFGICKQIQIESIYYIFLKNKTIYLFCFFFQTRNDFLQLLMDTANELSDDGTLNLNEKGDIAENYGKEENDQFFKTNTHLKKSKYRFIPNHREESVKALHLV